MSNFRRSLMSSSAETREYEFELNDYTLDGNNWIDTGLFPYNSGKNFEIETIVNATKYNFGYTSYLVSCCDMYVNSREVYRGFRLLFDGSANSRFYFSLLSGSDYSNYYTGEVTYKYIYKNGIEYVYVNNNLVVTNTRTITTSHSLKIGVGNYEEWEKFKTMEERKWHGTIKHFHLKYLE